MNKSYSLVWSAARNAFVVAGENARMRGKRSQGVTPLAAAVLLALSIVGSNDASAVTLRGYLPVSVASDDFNNGGTINRGMLVTTGGTYGINNDAAGTISGSSVGVWVNSGVTLGFIRNQGQILGAGQSSSGVGLVVTVGAITGGVSNSGLISGTELGVYTNASSIAGGVTNSGTISAGYLGILQTSTTITGGLVNDGMISAGTGDGVQLYLSTTLSGGLANSGTISSGRNGVRISSSSVSDGVQNSGVIDAARDGLSLSSATLSGGLANTGTITSGQAGVAIRSSAVAGDVSNGGLIDAGREALLVSSTTLVGGVTNGGTINSNSDAVFIQNSVVSGDVSNSGAISAAYTGLDIHSSTLSGGVTNSGTIDSGNHGMEVTGGGVAGDVLNSGVINSGSVGLSVWATLSRGVTNSGTISSNWSGMVIGGAVAGDVINGGVIAAGGTGLSATSALSGGLINSGVIQARNHGISLSYGTLAGGLTNSGTINCTSGGACMGIAVRGDATLNGGIDNSGSIDGGEAGVGIRSDDGYVDLWQGQTSSWTPPPVSLTGGISNSGTITGVEDGIQLHGSIVDGGIVNRGVISGEATGVRIGAGAVWVNNWDASTSYSTVGAGSTLTGGLINSGTISGGEYAVFVDDVSTLDSIVIAGNDTARFIGTVHAPSTPMSIAAGASYTLRSADDFHVASFTNHGTARFDAANGVTPHLDLTNVSDHTFANAGTLVVAAGTTGTITGDFRSTGTFHTSVTNSAVGKLVVSGTATLAGELAVDASALTSVQAHGNIISGVIAAGSVGGTFDSYGDNSPLFNFTPIYTATSMDLAITSTTGVRKAVTNTGNLPGIAAADVLDQTINADVGGPIAGLFLPLTSEQQVSDAVSQTLPLLTGGTSSVARGALGSMNDAVQSQIDASLGLPSGDALLSDRKVWLKPFGSWADQDDHNGVSGYDAQTMGFALGADGDVNAHTRVGVSFGYAKTDVDGNSSAAPQSADIDVYQLMGYGSHRLAPDTELSFRVGAGHMKTDGRRKIPLAAAVATSGYDSDFVTAGVGVSKAYKLSEKTTLTPGLRADYTWVDDEGYTERGAGALNLTVGGRTTESLVVALNGKIRHQLDDGFTLGGNLGVGIDTMAKRDSITATYAGAPGAAFTTRGMKPGRSVLKAGVELTKATASGMEVLARYDVEHREKFLNQSASVKLRWSF